MGGGIRQVWVGGSSTNYGVGPSAKYGGVISQVWVGGSSTNYGGANQPSMGGHQPSMGRGVINQVWVGGSSTNYGGWYHHVAMGDRGIYFPTSMYRNSKSRELL